MIFQNKESMPKCLRCGKILKPAKPKLVDINFYSCPNCSCNYARKPGQSLHDRWLMPITGPLYGVIFEEEHALKAKELAVEYYHEEDVFNMEIIIQHIKEELKNPTQKVSEIHEFINPDENKIREFLSLFVEELEKLYEKNDKLKERKEARIEIAKHLMKKEVDVDVIVKSSGLSKKEIENM